MKLSDEQILELNRLIKKAKLDLPITKKIVLRENQTYNWLRQNVLTKNLDKLKKNPRLVQLLDLQIPQEQSINMS